MSQLLKTKSIETLVRESECGDKRLRRTLGPWSLIAFGIGAVIGSGIFTLTGTAAAGMTFDFRSVFNAPVLDLILHGTKAVSTVGRPGAGPGITLSFVLVAFACSFAALCYAELASMIPIAGYLPAAFKIGWLLKKLDRQLKTLESNLAELHQSDETIALLREALGKYHRSIPKLKPTLPLRRRLEHIMPLDDESNSEASIAQGNPH